jgi:hypothetical protein
MGIFLEEMMLDFPRVIDADTISELDLFQWRTSHNTPRTSGRLPRWAPVTGS